MPKFNEEKKNKHSRSAPYTARKSVIREITDPEEKAENELYETKFVSDRETDIHRIEQRQKQIDFGKVRMMILGGCLERVVCCVSSFRFISTHLIQLSHTH